MKGLKGEMSGGVLGHLDLGTGGEGCYSILSIKNNTRFYIQMGLSAQSTGLKCMKDHMRSLCVCVVRQ